MGLERQLANSTSALFREVNLYQTAIDLANQYQIPQIVFVGCSTGEEVYSTAYLDQDSSNKTFLGIDANKERINTAQVGIYSMSPMNRMERQFTTIEKLIQRYCAPQIDGDTWTVNINQAIRELTKFEVHNMLESPLPNPTPLIVCANVLWHYWADSNADKLISYAMHRNLYRSLQPQGLLITDQHSYNRFEPYLNTNLWKLRPELKSEFPDQPKPSKFAQAVVIERLDQPKDAF